MVWSAWLRSQAPGDNTTTTAAAAAAATITMKDENLDDAYFGEFVAV
jgi:hypothetical protein